MSEELLNEIDSINPGMKQRIIEIMKEESCTIN